MKRKTVANTTGTHLEGAGTRHTVRYRTHAISSVGCSTFACDSVQTVQRSSALLRTPEPHRSKKCTLAVLSVRFLQSASSPGWCAEFDLRHGSSRRYTRR